MIKASDKKIKLPYAGRADIINIFKLIHERKEPKPINKQKLKTVGINSPNYVIAMLKNLEFLNDDNALSDTANDLRGTPDKFKKCLEERVSVLYKDLFNTIKDALILEKENGVRNYFRNHFTGVKDSMLRMLTNCFLALRDIINSGGNFEALEKQRKSAQAISGKTKGKVNKTMQSTQLTNVESHKSHANDIKFTLNLNINLDIGTSKEAIEELFKNILFAQHSTFGKSK